MSSERVETNQKWLDMFNKAARESHVQGTITFRHYVEFLGGNFDLAVLNVGHALFGKVIPHENLMTPKQRRENPGVFLAISCARAEMSPQPMALCN